LSAGELIVANPRRSPPVLRPRHPTGANGPDNRDPDQSFSVQEEVIVVMSQTDLVLVALVLGCLALAGYSKWSLVRESRGLEIHAHSDGTVHEHHRGAVPHTHPTLAERHERLVARVFREPSAADS
jgi:hypothetical protein